MKLTEEPRRIAEELASRNLLFHAADDIKSAQIRKKGITNISSAWRVSHEHAANPRAFPRKAANAAYWAAQIASNIGNKGEMRPFSLFIIDGEKAKLATGKTRDWPEMLVEEKFTAPKKSIIAEIRFTHHDLEEMVLGINPNRRRSSRKDNGTPFFHPRLSEEQHYLIARFGQVIAERTLQKLHELGYVSKTTTSPILTKDIFHGIFKKPIAEQEDFIPELGYKSL